MGLLWITQGVDIMIILHRPDYYISSNHAASVKHVKEVTNWSKGKTQHQPHLFIDDYSEWS